MPHKDPEARRQYERERYWKKPGEKDARNKRSSDRYDAAREQHLARNKAYRESEAGKEKRREYYLRNIERSREASRRHRRNNPGCRTEECRRSRARHPDKHKSWQLRTAYGITLDDYNRMLAEQGGGCWICKAPPAQKYLDVDHDHETGVVRGLLCRKCNTAVGYIEHLRRDLFGAAIEYLTRAKQCQSVVQTA